MYLLFVESVVIGYGSIDCVAIVFCLAKSHVPRKKNEIYASVQVIFYPEKKNVAKNVDLCHDISYNNR